MHIYTGANAYLVAIPLHRARRLRATRSPRSRYRTLPRTVATCLMGSNSSPSCKCHSTLICKAFSHPNPPEDLRRSLASQLLKYLRKERHTGQDRSLLPLSKQIRFALSLSYDESPVIEGRSVFSKPGCHLSLPARGQQVSILWERA